MSGESTPRGLLRDATLAGAALLIGAGVLSATGCCKKEKAEVKRLTAENDSLQKSNDSLRMSVVIDTSGNLIVQGKDLRDKLCDIWNQQLQKDKRVPPSNTLGIQVQFDSCIVTMPGKEPESGKVNSLCKC